MSADRVKVTPAWWGGNVPSDTWIWPRVALGSAAEYDVSRPQACLRRLAEALPAICDEDGVPLVKLHGLRMLNGEIVERVPLSSADSTNVARNIKFDQAWTGAYAPATKETRVDVLIERIERSNSPARMAHVEFYEHPTLWEATA